jgi:molybdopterin converting factor small subunit
MTVLVRYWAGARAAAGCEQESYDDAADLAALLVAVTRRHAADTLPTVLARCSYLVNEVSPGTTAHAAVPVPTGAVVEVLPPFAGGAGRNIAGPSGVVPA